MLTGTTRRLTAGERAREPRSLALVAWFDGYTRAHNPAVPPHGYPRPLAPAEAREWRAGWAEGRRELVCHTWHGFTPCDGTHPTREKDT